MRVVLCGRCMDAHATAEGPIVEGAPHSSFEELTGRTLWGDKVVTY